MIQNRIYNYFERNPQLHVLFIFDKMDIIQTELEDVKEWADGYIYKVFDGAWFNTKYAIENTWKDKRIVLLFPVGTYPHSEEQQLQFPLLDMLKANMDIRKMIMLLLCSSIICQNGSVVLSRKILRKSCLLKSIIFLMGISIRTHSVRIWFAVLSFPIISARKNCWIGKQSLSK